MLDLCSSSAGGQVLQFDHDGLKGLVASYSSSTVGVSQHLAAGAWWRMMFSENRCPLFGIMRQFSTRPSCCVMSTAFSRICSHQRGTNAFLKRIFGIAMLIAASGAPPL